ncbi:hypothetical protein [Streptomyces sp. Ncost-T10-10d]|uniref:hypothetical protein n=1 Tax=Streptomyces sp. Ncost-T10-10d TaxID=1839774 RepID=UPI00159F1942|nr:hypothetical protein [Streptomyces sp. Ncost-T10-10d]
MPQHPLGHGGAPAVGATGVAVADGPGFATAALRGTCASPPALWGRRTVATIRLPPL